MVSVIRSPVPCQNANFKPVIKLKLLSPLKGERNKVLPLFFLNLPTFLFYLVHIKHESSVDKASKGQLKNEHEDKVLAVLLVFARWLNAFRV